MYYPHDIHDECNDEYAFKSQIGVFKHLLKYFRSVKRDLIIKINKRYDKDPPF